MIRRLIITAMVLAVLGAVMVLTPDQSQSAPPSQSLKGRSTSEADIESSLKGSELLHTIYLANRAEGKDSIKLLEQASQQAGSATAEQINLAPKPLGRAALHWTVLGSLQAKPGGHLDAYLRLAEVLIAGGADVNVPDAMGITLLDWQDFAEDDDMSDLLVEYGARRSRGTNVAEEVVPILEYISDLVVAGDTAQLREQVRSDLPLGGRISIRLLDPVSSNHSRPGDIVQAVTIAPVLDGKRVTLPAGTVIEGVVASATPAGTQYERAKLALFFRRVVHQNGERSPIFARLIDVDNARETIQPNVAIGMAFPRSKLDKISWGTRVAGFAYPGLGYAIEAASLGYSEGLKREIVYGPGVDMTLSVTLPTTIKGIPTSPPPPTFARIAELRQLINALPKRNASVDGKDADVTNILFVGTREEVVDAFQSSGWLEAKDLTTTSALKTFVATAYSKGYSEAPLSKLYLESKLPDLEFEKQTNTFAKRHHVRIYQRMETFEGHPLWAAAATHDIGIRALDKGTKWTHAVDPHIDRERNKIGIDLMFGGNVRGIALVERAGMPVSNQSIAGHMLLTDGRVLVVGLDSARETLQPRQEWDVSILIPPDPVLPDKRDGGVLPAVR